MRGARAYNPRANIRIVSVPFEVKATLGSSEISLRAFAENLVRQARFRGRQWAVTNAGFSSYRLDVPLGLLVTDGKVYSNVSKEKPKRNYNQTLSEFAKFRWSGILCKRANADGWDIIATGRYQPGSCRHAVQGGPTLIEPDFKLGITAEEQSREKPYRRTAVCLKANGQMSIILTGETQLYPLAQWLRKPERDRGMACRVLSIYPAIHRQESH